jgi:hypothetical protein
MRWRGRPRRISVSVKTWKEVPDRRERESHGGPIEERARSIRSLGAQDGDPDARSRSHCSDPRKMRREGRMARTRHRVQWSAANMSMNPPVSSHRRRALNENGQRRSTSDSRSRSSTDGSRSRGRRLRRRSGSGICIRARARVRSPARGRCARSSLRMGVGLAPLAPVVVGCAFRVAPLRTVRDGLADLSAVQRACGEAAGDSATQSHREAPAGLPRVFADSQARALSPLTAR